MTTQSQKKLYWPQLIAAAGFSAAATLFVNSIKEDQTRGKELAVIQDSLFRLEKKVDQQRTATERALEALRASDAAHLDKIVKNATDIAVMQERQSRFERHLEEEH